jgi:hypothetical protein
MLLETVLFDKAASFPENLERRDGRAFYSHTGRVGGLRRTIIGYNGFILYTNFISWGLS